MFQAYTVEIISVAFSGTITPVWVAQLYYGIGGTSYSSMSGTTSIGTGGTTTPVWVAQRLRYGWHKMERYIQIC
ncbi:MAG: hypothetical protein K9G61_08165 [Bacteroidales bacterium]|nr:hypothetical protein [Bacteroidales bacterium]